MADSEAAQMRKVEYWDKRYSDDNDPPPTEWHVGYDQLDDYLKQNVWPRWPAGTQPKVVHLGSGSSSVPFEMFKQGYTDQTCVEFSTAVLAQMAPQNPDIRWLPYDVRAMPGMDSGSFDMAFDKSTFYALCGWGTTHLLKEIPEIIQRDTRSYSQEVYRILKPGGVFIIVTIYEPRYLYHLIKCEGTDWEDAHLPIVLTEAGWAQTRAYCLRKKETAVSNEPTTA